MSLLALVALLIGLAWLLSSVENKSTGDYFREKLGLKNG